MSDQIAIRLSGVGKMYRIYPSRLDNFLDALNLARFMPWRRIKPREFWALRDINFELKKGSRLGIIGRNGAGKSTLLKLITGNLPPTEGVVEVNGQVQALLEAGAGFHPEFTGYENIRAALTYQGFTSKEIEAAIEDITEFTELGQFLAQPFKTYSAGMQARLVFATATTLKPDILIIDEILGAGDAYFANKSAERMKELVKESGASVLLVSHGMAQILQYCDECIWVERGRIVKYGSSTEVVTAYEAFIYAMEDRRLKAKNRKRRASHLEPTDNYSDFLLLTFQVQGELGNFCDIAEIALLKNGQVEETLRVGDVQDASWSHMAVLMLEGSQWSEPQRESRGYSRRLAITSNGSDTVKGSAIFYAYALFDDAQYQLEINYRNSNAARFGLTISRNGTPIKESIELPAQGANWVKHSIPLGMLSSPNGKSTTEQHAPQPVTQTFVRWPSEGSITIEKIALLDMSGQEQTVFPVGSTLTMSMTIIARRAGHYNFLPTATLNRLDGILISNFIPQPFLLDLAIGEIKEFHLDLTPLNLGDGQYIFSFSIFEEKVAGESRYDLISRAYEFQVIGNHTTVASAIFQHPGTWTLIG